MARNKKRQQAPVLSTLSVKYFRGIADPQTIDFNNKGKLIVLYGENGTGKSSFVNALEYLFKGKLEDLTSQTIDKKQKPEFHYGSNTEDWEIKLTFNGNRYALRNSAGLNTDKNLRKLIRNNTSFFKNTSFILNRKKLLGFINTTEGKRFESISKLCGFDDVEPIQKTFNQTEKHYKELLTQNNSKLNSLENEILSILNINDNTEIHAKLNENLSKLDKELIDENTDLRNYLDNFDISSEIHLIKRYIENFNDIFTKLEINNLEESLSGILHEYSKLGIESFSLIRQSETLLNQSLTFINSNNLDTCPVCERELTKEILNSITERISSFKNILKSFNNTEGEIRRFQQVLRNNVQVLNQINEILKNIDDLDEEIKFIENCKGNFINLSNDLTNLINFNISSLDLKDKYNLNIKEELYEINRKVNNLIEKEKDDNYDKLKNIKKCIEKLTEYNAVKEKIPPINSKYELSVKLKQQFDESKENYINNLIDELEEDIDKFYSYIHEDDEISTVSMNLSGTSKLRFYINSFGQDADPRSFSSEGHLDSLGICVYLALMKKRNPLNFIVLDDVITSVDLTHKDKIARLIISEFKHYKILITTHNPLWAEQLQRICEGYGRTYEILQITNWQLGIGPNIKNHSNNSETIIKYLNDYEYNAAANTSRRFLEYLLSEFCQKHSVNLKLKEKYTAGDLKDPVEYKSKEIVKETNLEEYLNYIWKEFNLYDYVGNKLSHHNKDAYFLTGPEVVPFCELVIELNKALNHCIDCEYESELIYDKDTHEVKCSEKCKLKN